MQQVKKIIRFFFITGFILGLTWVQGFSVNQDMADTRIAGEIQVNENAVVENLRQKVEEVIDKRSQFPIREAYHLLLALQRECDGYDRRIYKKPAEIGSSISYDFIISVHAILKIGAIALNHYELSSLHDDYIKFYNDWRGVSVTPYSPLNNNSFMTSGSPLRALFNEYLEIEVTDRNDLTFNRFSISVKNDSSEIGNRILSIEVAGNPDDSSVRARRFAEVFTLSQREPIIPNGNLKHIISEVERDGYGIKTSDYFFPPEVNLDSGIFENRWNSIKKNLALFSLRRDYDLRMTSSANYFIPSGDYFVSYVDPSAEAEEQILPDSKEVNFSIRRDDKSSDLKYIFSIDHNNQVNIEREYLNRAPKFSFKEVLIPDFKHIDFSLGSNSRSGGIDASFGGLVFYKFSKSVAFQAQLQYAYRQQEDIITIGDNIPLEVITPWKSYPVGDYTSSDVQLDLGPVFRVGDFQFAGLQSIRWVKRNSFQNTGAIGHFFFNAGYLFDFGQIGVFFTKADIDEPVVNTIALDIPGYEEYAPVFFQETYLKVVDQYGVNFQLSVSENSYVEGELGYLKTYRRSSAPGGVVRYFAPPFWKGRLQAYGEFGVNESFVSIEDSYRFGGGIRLFGASGLSKMLKMKEPVPVVAPRVRYETLTRIVKKGSLKPVAMAGEDINGITPGETVCLDGRSSFDPDGTIAEYQWTQIDGESVELQNPDTSTPCFVVGNGQSYEFQLFVVDNEGLKSEPDFVTVSSVLVKDVVISKWQISKEVIEKGDSIELSWTVLNAVSIEITDNNDNLVHSETELDPSIQQQGQFIVHYVIDDNTYTLTACNSLGSCTVSSQLTVTVNPETPVPVIAYFEASPQVVKPGGIATLSWSIQYAESVRITGPNGDVIDRTGLDPEEQEVDSIQVILPEGPGIYTYTLNTSNSSGSDEATVDIEVQTMSPPVIAYFEASPQVVKPGGMATLSWSIQYAESVRITSPNGDVIDRTGLDPEEEEIGSIQAILPETPGTYIYTLSTSNSSGSDEATVNIEVITISPPEIAYFQVSPQVVDPGGMATLSWSIKYAESVRITGPDGDVIDRTGLDPDEQESDSIQVILPEIPGTYTYTLNTSNSSGNDEASVEIEVKTMPAPVIAYFQASPQVFEPGGIATLSWSIQNAESVRIVGPEGVEPINKTGLSPEEQEIDSIQVTLPQTPGTYTYTLEALNSSGSATATVDIEVVDMSAPVIEMFEIEEGTTTVRKGVPFHLLWIVTGAENGHITLTQVHPYQQQELGQSGRKEMQIYEDTVLTLEACNEWGRCTSASISMTVTEE